MKLLLSPMMLKMKGPVHVAESIHDNKNYVIRPIILFATTMVVIGEWLCIVMTGTHFHHRYPQYTFNDAFELAMKHFGNDICYGSRLNALECDFEDGEFINFNLTHPFCRGNHLCGCAAEP